MSERAPKNGSLPVPRVTDSHVAREAGVSCGACSGEQKAGVWVECGALEQTVGGVSGAQRLFWESI